MKHFILTRLTCCFETQEARPYTLPSTSKYLMCGFFFWFLPSSSPISSLSFLVFCLGAGGASGRVLESAGESQSKHKNVLCDGFHVRIIRYRGVHSEHTHTHTAETCRSVLFRISYIFNAVFGGLVVWLKLQRLSLVFQISNRDQTDVICGFVNFKGRCLPPLRSEELSFNSYMMVAIRFWLITFIVQNMIRNYTEKCD